MSLPFYPNLLLIAGSGRHTGKTTLAEHIIRRYAQSCEIIGLKVSSIYPGEEAAHGRKALPLDDAYRIMEETDRSGRKDTSRMLLAGAAKAFFVQATDDHLVEAMAGFFESLPAKSLLVCESGSLRFVLKPGLFLLLDGHPQGRHKERFNRLQPLADLCVSSNGGKPDFRNERILLTENGWALKGYKGG